MSRRVWYVQKVELVVSVIIISPVMFLNHQNQMTLSLHPVGAHIDSTRIVLWNGWKGGKIRYVCDSRCSMLPEFF